MINQFNIWLLFLSGKNIRPLEPILPIMTLYLFSCTRIPSIMETDCYSVIFFPCWCNQWSNSFQSIFILFSTFIIILRKKGDKAIQEKLVLFLHTEDVILLKYILRKIIIKSQTFCSQKLFGYFNAFCRKTNFELIQKYLCMYSLFRFNFSKRKLHISMSFKSTQKWFYSVDLI